MPVYIVSEGKIIEFPDATVAKISANGQAVHVIRANTIIGNFPAYKVKYYGIELPPQYLRRWEEQKAWEALTPEERGRRSADAQARRKGLVPGEPEEGRADAEEEPQ